MSQQLYRLYDVKKPEGDYSDEERGLIRQGAVPITREEATHWNALNCAVYWGVNLFNGRRRIADLVKLTAWFADMDSGTKDEQWARIKAGLIPSLIVESKRGFQPYWLSKNATVEGYRSILIDRLVPFYRADPKAALITQLLRVPGYYHCKDPNDRFMVRRVHRHAVLYTEEEICDFYPPSRESIEREAHGKEFKSIFNNDLGAGETDDIWRRIWRMDCEAALDRLSGHEAVGGEVFTFRRVGSGNLNILVNGKGTSCWIDRQGRIGSTDKGGPSVYQWVNYYHRNPSKTMSYLRKAFPELWSMNPEKN